MDAEPAIVPGSECRDTLIRCPVADLEWGPGAEVAPAVDSLVVAEADAICIMRPVFPGGHAPTAGQLLLHRVKRRWQGREGKS